MHIYLASKSPRRQLLLKQIGISFDGIEIEIDETPHEKESPSDYVVRIALDKAQAGWLESSRTRNIPLLAADTSVIIDHEILGKPANRRDAIMMLNRLSGKTHQVMTCVAIKDESKLVFKISVTDVSFCSLVMHEIEYYVDTGDCMDKAGSYGIQGYAGSFISHISGSYSGVVGLPLFETSKLLQQFDV